MKKNNIQIQCNKVTQWGKYFSMRSVWLNVLCIEIYILFIRYLTVEPFNCDQCNKSFRGRNNLVIHQIYTMGKVFQMCQCDIFLIQISHLISHLFSNLFISHQTHSGAMTFNMIIVVKQITHRSVLTNYQRI